MFNEALIWLDGRKTYISAITLIIVPYLVSMNVLSVQLGAVITAIVGILTGTGKYVSDFALNNNTDLGLAIKEARLKK